MENSDILKAIMERTSIRNFEKDKRIPEELLRKILDAGIKAPSAGNIQPRTFILAEGAAVKKRLYELCEGQAFMNDAPVWIVVCVDLHRHLKAARLTGVEYDYTGILPYTMSVLDAALSLENMTVAAESLGLGSVMIGSVIEHPEEARQILDLPDHCLALCILCIGYPKRKPETREKWDYKTMVCKNAYEDLQVNDVLEYWKKIVLGDLKRSGRAVLPQVVEKYLRERNYGKSYSNHYKEDFIKTTNSKLMEFLRKQGFIKN
jgi:nitroreductase